MSDPKERIQLNLRLDGHRELYDAVKVRATTENTSVNQFVINALRSALGWELIESTLSPKTEVLESRLAALEERLALVISLEERLAKVENELGESVA